MRRLKKYIKNNWIFFTLALSSTLFSLILDMFNPKIVEQLIDKVIVKNNIALLPKLLIILAIITISRAIFGYFREYFMDLGGSKLAAELRQDLFTHLQKLSFSFFDSINTGELMSRIKEDIENIWFAFGFGIMLFFEQSLYFIIATIILLNINWELTFLVLLIMPIIGIIAYRLEVETDKVYGEISDQGVKMNTTAQEDIAGIRVVKSFAREKYEIEKFLTQNQKNYQLNLKQAKILSRYSPWIDFLTNFAVALTITTGGIIVIKDKMSIGTLVAFSGYVSMLVWPMRMSGWLINILSQCKASLGKIEKLFNKIPEIIDDKDAKDYEIKGHIIFKNVSFKYKNEYILHDINFEVKPGKTLAIMGPTGSGKTTIINLIGRFYNPTMGKILIDNNDITKIKLTSLRNSISYIPQDVFLFSDTVEENIRFGDNSISEQDIINSLKISHAYNFVMKLPEKLKTVIGERGIGLSGGQKQRISIARALARKSKILIMDDATSALDMETEYKIQKELRKIENLTKIIIAHRISAVKDADEIIVLDKGKIIERGTHETLLAKKGFYYNTYLEQYGKYFEVDEEVI
ncbi:ABC transporter ATP-binding protein [Caldicellulosiruptoraceae bacterium PP1]